MFSKVKVISIKIEVLFEMRVVHKIRKFFRNGEITVTCHLFTRVDTARVVQAWVVVVGIHISVVPQTS